MSQLLFASSLSRASDSAAALEATTRELAVQLDGQRPDLVTAFVSQHHEAAFEGLGPTLSALTRAGVVLGCRGESIVGPDEEVEGAPAIALWAACLPRTVVRPFQVDVTQTPEGQFAFSCLPEVHDAANASVLLFANPHTFPAGEYLELLNERMEGVPAIGGMASGTSGPEQPMLFDATGMVEGGALGAVIEGEVEVRSIVSQGCRPVAKPLVITACKSNFILKLGGRPAVEVLMETLQGLPPGDRMLLSTQPFVGLALDARKSSFERGDFLVRGLLGIDPQQGALAIGDDSIRAGMTIQFLVRDALSAGEDLVQLMRARGAGVGGSNTGALIFSCNGRGTRMFATANHDIGCLQSAFESRVPAAGFFAAGEIGPVGGKNFVHGFTASVALFRARA